MREHTRVRHTQALDPMHLQALIDDAPRARVAVVGPHPTRRGIVVAAPAVLPNEFVDALVVVFAFGDVCVEDGVLLRGHLFFEAEREADGLAHGDAVALGGEVVGVYGGFFEWVARCESDGPHGRGAERDGEEGKPAFTVERGVPP